MRAIGIDVCAKFKLKGLEDHDFPFPESIDQGNLTPLLLPGRGRLKLLVYIHSHVIDEETNFVVNIYN
jgi:hypothetical protein